MQTTEIIFNRTGQVVEFYPPEAVREARGIPSSVTYSVHDGPDSNDDTPLFSGNATVDSVSTTLSAAAGISQTTRNRITVAANTGIVTGRLYLLDNSLYQREVVEPTKINSTVLDLGSDLKYDYALTVSTLKGVRCSFTVDSTWVQSEENINHPAHVSYRVRWQYTVDGTVYNYQTYLRLVRKAFKSSITPLDIADFWPEVFHKEPPQHRGEKFRRMIDAAEDLVRSDIIAEGYKPEQIHDTEIVDRLTRLALFYQIAQFVGAPSGLERETFIERTRRDYAELFGKTISSLRVGLDESDEGSTSTAPIARYFFVR